MRFLGVVAIFVVALALQNSSGVQLSLNTFGEKAIHDSVFYLDSSQWSLTGLPVTRNDYENRPIVQVYNVTVPGDLLTNLESAGVIPDPLLDNTIQSKRVTEFIRDYSWKYAIKFTLSSPDHHRVRLPSPSQRMLVFESIKMGAIIMLNGKRIGKATDQFVRLIIPWPEVFEATTEFLLEVTFDPRIEVDGRFMACSGGWDWSPYSNVTNSQGALILSKGIVRSVYIVVESDTFLNIHGTEHHTHVERTSRNHDEHDLENISLVNVKNGANPPMQYVAKRRNSRRRLRNSKTSIPVAIEHIVPHVYYKGAYPLQKLCETHDNQRECHDAWKFEVDTKVHVVSLLKQHTLECNISLNGDWTVRGTAPQKLVLHPLQRTVVSLQRLYVSSQSTNVSLWWPSGTGEPHLHTISTTITNCSIYQTSSDHRDTPKHRTPVSEIGMVNKQPAYGYLQDKTQIGFRVVALVTEDDKQPEFESRFRSATGSGSHGMFFRVNGVAIYSRGANFIPMEVLEGRESVEAYVQLLRSVHDVNANMLRVWGGGTFLPKIWYHTCDKLGIMIYHDMQFAQGNHSPNASSAVQSSEIRYQIRRLASHPSIVLWDGCNECQVSPNATDPTNVYASFVLRIVAEEDPSRAIWPSSPSYGWQSGVDRLYSKPIPGEVLVPIDANQAIASHQWNMEFHGPYEHGTGWPTVNAAYPLGLLVPVAPLWGAPWLSETTDENSDQEVSTQHESRVKTIAEDHSRIGSDSKNRTFASRILEHIKIRHTLKMSSKYGPSVRSKYRSKMSSKHEPSVRSKYRSKMSSKHEPLFRSKYRSKMSPKYGPSVRNKDTSKINRNFGTSVRNQFVSEFGATGFSSFESVSATLSEDAYSLHGGTEADVCTMPSHCSGSNVMAQRNYPCDNMIQAYFDGDGQLLNRLFHPELNADTRKQKFIAQLYLCQYAQMLHVKGQIEGYRVSNVLGMLVWQLNEVWPTGGWGSIEYGPRHREGQVTGGRWKPVHYLYKSSLFADHFALCGVDKITCMVKNEVMQKVHVKVLVHQPVSTSNCSKVVNLVHNETALMSPGPGTMYTFRLPNPITSPMWFVSVFKMNDAKWILQSHQVQQQVPTWKLVQHSCNSESCVSGETQQPLTVSVASEMNQDGSITITINSNVQTTLRNIVWWLGVTLSTAVPGRFSDNSFIMMSDTRGIPQRSSCVVQHRHFSELQQDAHGCNTVLFLPFATSDGMMLEQLRSTLRIEHFGQYLPN